MNSKLNHRVFFTGPIVLFTGVILTAFFLIACSDTDNETNLVDIHTTASQDIIAISFPEDSTETTLSINSLFEYSLQGLKSNGLDLVTISSHIQWSLSEGTASTIDQQGLFKAGDRTEIITLTAKFGFLSESIEIRVSAAKFDQVVQLDEQAISIDMCQSQEIKPVGLYVDENGNEEIRPVDSTSINNIEWIISNQEDNNISQRAYIKTANNQATLHALAAGNITIQAKATSEHSGNEVTSVDFNQNIDAALNSIKLCLNGDTDLNNCNVSNANVVKDEVLSLIAVGNYQAEDGSSFNENISSNSKWGISNDLNASIVFSSDRQQLDITGIIEGSTANISVACGNIDQDISDIDVSQGVVLSSAVSCTVDECLDASIPVNIDNLSVLSFDVTANEIDLNDNESITLINRPAEITLSVTANFSNDSQLLITEDDNLVYFIITTDGQADVIEEKADSSGTFTVLGEGTARIQLDYRGKTFLAVIIVP